MQQEEGDDEQYEKQSSHSLSDDEYENYPSSDSPSPSRADGGRHLSSPSKRSVSAVAGPSSHPIPTTPFRPPAIKSVKDVVARLDGDSPPQPSPPSRSVKGKGKMREVGVEPQLSWPTVDKGKGPAMPRSTATSVVHSTVVSGENARSVDALKRSANIVASAEDPKGSRPTIDEEAARRRIRELEEKVRSLENEVLQSHCIYIF